MTKAEKFEAWAEKNGGIIVAITNPHEWSRFKAYNRTFVIYTGKKRGMTFSCPDAQHIYENFENSKSLRLANKPARYDKDKAVIERIIKRDGNTCFYCNEEFDDKRPSTLEHFVARSHSGPNHISNYGLACRGCNNLAGNLSVAEKLNLAIATRERSTA